MYQVKNSIQECLGRFISCLLYDLYIMTILPLEYNFFLCDGSYHDIAQIIYKEYTE